MPRPRPSRPHRSALLAATLGLVVALSACSVGDGPSSHRVDPDAPTSSTSPTPTGPGPGPSDPGGPSRPSPSTTPDTSPTPSTTLPKGTPRLNLTNADSGRTLSIAPGTELVITLKPGGDQPNNSWRISRYTSSQFKFLGQDTGVGRTVFRFLTVSGNPADLALRWSDPTLSTQPADAPVFSISAQIS